MSDLSELSRLEDDLEKDEGLRKKLDEAARRIAEEGKAGSDVEAISAAAAELGYDVSVADLERASAEGADVDDAELELVAGGFGTKEDEYGHDVWCFTAWHCTAATLHTETKSHEVACWSDYMCFFVVNHDTPETMS
ncbi:MAG: hypothetical protein Q4B54_13095 [Coriobacteriales bacterium]|nr:hypothetical protein [Coriobacteriales bacterium]